MVLIILIVFCSSPGILSFKPGSQYDARGCVALRFNVNTLHCACIALRSKRKDRINFYLALRSLRATQRNVLRHIVNQALLAKKETFWYLNCPCAPYGC